MIIIQILQDERNPSTLYILARPAGLRYMIHFDSTSPWRSLPKQTCCEKTPNYRHEGCVLDRQMRERGRLHGSQSNRACFNDVQDRNTKYGACDLARIRKRQVYRDSVSRSLTSSAWRASVHLPVMSRGVQAGRLQEFLSPAEVGVVNHCSAGNTG